MTWAAVAVALPVITSAVLLARLSGTPRRILAHLAGAASIGIGASSAVWWTIMLLPLGSRSALIALDAVLWAIASLVVWRVARSPAPPNDDRSRRWAARWPAVALLSFALTPATVYFVAASVALPHGTWDAWAIWNARARFLVRGYPDVWMQAFSPALGWSHPDYPLLVPASVARTWTYVGGVSVLVPILLAATFSVAILTTAATAVARAATAWRGALTAVIILASPAFLSSAVAQCADIPLAFYVLATCVFVDRATEAGARPAWWAVAGLATSLAAWTKNEGIAFAALAIVGCSVWAYRSDRWRGLARIAPLFAGAAPVLIALAAFKVLVAPTNDMVAAQTMNRALSDLHDVARITMVAMAVGKELWLGGARFIGALPILALFVLVVGIRRPLPAGPMLGLAMAGAMVAVDVLVYIVTPMDLVWHLRTSVQRVVLQVFPALVWCGMSLAAAPVRAPSPRVGA